MLKIRGERIRWGEGDILTMARILGPQFGTKQQAPIQHSILKQADKLGLLLSKKAKRELSEALEFHREMKELKDRVRDDADYSAHPHFWHHFDGFWKHQRADLDYIRQSGLRSFLVAHEPTVGKTNVAIGLVRMLNILAGGHYPLGFMRPTPSFVRRVLVICRNRAKEQWAREIVRWGGSKTIDEKNTGRGWYTPHVQIIDGTIPQQIQQIVHPLDKHSSHVHTVWVIAHWEALVHARIGFMQRRWDMVIADEAHQAQNRKAQRSETLFEIPTIWKLALTGSAYDGQDVGTMFSILHWLWPDIYPSYWRFIAQHAHVTPLPFGGFEVGAARKPKLLRWEIAPFTLRRTIAEVRPDLPPIRRVRVTTRLSPRYVKEFKILKKQFFAELEAEFGSKKTVVIPNAMARTTRLRQWLIDPGLLGGSLPSLKYPEILDLQRELNAPLIVFTMFRQAGIRLNAFLAKHKKSTGLISGEKGRPKGANDRDQRRFMRGDLDVLSVVIQAGGESLNLGKYGFGASLDFPWRVRDWAQLEGRFNRPEEGTGITVPATIWRLVTSGTYEEKMEARLGEGHKNYGKVFTLNDLRELFA